MPVYPNFYFPIGPPGTTATVKRDPCPACRGDEYRFVQQILRCTGCNRTRDEAETFVKTYAQRDGNGSLLCQGCGDPYPYAEPDSDGRFKCRSCKTGLDPA